MRLVAARKNCVLLRQDGTVVYPLSKFLSERFNNPHTRELVAQALRVFYRFCCAHRIELARLATEGRCLSYDHARALVGLCFRPLEELESLSDAQIVKLTSPKASKAPQDMKEAVEPNTAIKRLNHICLYIQFFREVFLEPNLQSSTLRQQLNQEYSKISHQLKTAVSGTKQGHHHDIKSLPSDKFLAIIRAIVICPQELFLSENGKVSRNLLRDRAMALLACEGLRPGTIGSVGRTDFRPLSCHMVIKDNRSKREKTTTNTPVLKLGASILVNSASETMIELWPFTVDAIQSYINVEREAVLSKHLKNRGRGFLFLTEKGEPIKHRASITELFTRLRQRLGQMGLLDVGTDPYFREQKQYDFYSYVLRHSASSLFLEFKGTDARVLDSMKARFGWTMNSNQPERYAARALSDKAGIDLMNFSAELMAEVQANKKPNKDA